MAKAKPTEPEDINPAIDPDKSTEADEAPAPETAAEIAVDETNADTTAKAGKRSAKAIREAEAAEIKQAAKTADDKPKVHKPQQKRNPLKQHGKKYRKSAELVDRDKEYELAEAIELAKKTVTVKFVPSLELHVNLGVDPRQADQMVRASVVLPAGTGKTIRIAVLTPTAKQADAKKAGADIVGDDDLIAKIEKGKIDFDKLIASPDVMPKLGKLAKLLGPKGLMPNPKSGSVTNDVAKAVTEAKAGKVEFRIDKQAIVHQTFGKASFSDADLLENLKVLIQAIMKAKPSAAKGTYVESMSLTTTMGPGIKLSASKAIAEANPRK